MQCQKKKRDGNQCRARARSGQKYCALHAEPGEAAELGSKGGRRRAVYRPEITADNVLHELAKLAFFDPRKLFNPDGSPRHIAELDDDTAMALAGFEMIEQFEGSGDNRKHVGYLKKFKFVDKGQNLERLGRILGMFIERYMTDLPHDWDSHTIEEKRFYVKKGHWPEPDDE